MPSNIEDYSFQILCRIYNEYLHKIQTESPSNARIFRNPSTLKSEFLSDYTEEEIHNAVIFLNKLNYVKAYIDNSFQLTDYGIEHSKKIFKRKSQLFKKRDCYIYRTNKRNSAYPSNGKTPFYKRELFWAAFGAITSAVGAIVAIHKGYF